MGEIGVESVLVAGRGPAACAVITACQRLGVKTVSVHSATERGARHVRLADESVLLGPAPAEESYLAVDRLVEAAQRSGVSAVLPVPPALAGNARLAQEVHRAGLTWVGPDAEVLDRIGGDGVEPASERGLLALVTAAGLEHVTPVRRDRAAGIARVTWTTDDVDPLPAAAQRLAAVGWRGLATVGVDPDGELAEVAAGFPLDMAVLERAHGVDAVELALRSAVRPRGRSARRGRVEPVVQGKPWQPAVAVQLRSTLPPGRGGVVRGPLPGIRPTTGGAVAFTGYEPGDRLDGWYDALLVVVSAAGPDVASAAAEVMASLAHLPETGVPHDGPAVCAVLEQLVAGQDPAGA
ncbi:carbamoyl-phosphate-synthetase [Modestobacter sp. I12A-02628]|uniref:biotin carboxylase n=2 Tax=Goekera deserti TaxID=2497753 RepID=A0A7K3W9H1_9ACTN|nr:carbamoyl-phosphate-synthetase [Goekera deserti]NDI50054.1 carbamoyl-phosphate-synthetase [Goekera deserti]NEL52470.1 carbamoyl-phosphate-synthetase [Goekera deserti]